MKYVKTFDEHLNEGIIDKIKALFGKGKIKDLGIDSLKDDDPTRRPSDEEFALARKFSKSVKGDLGGIGVDKKTGNINVEVDFNDGGSERYVLTPEGKETEDSKDDREYRDREWKYATDFAKKMKGSLDAFGSDSKYIHVMVDDVEYKLDKNGKEV